MKVLDKSNSITYRETPPQDLQLNENHVDVWLASLDMDENILVDTRIVYTAKEFEQKKAYIEVI